MPEISTLVPFILAALVAAVVPAPAGAACLVWPALHKRA